MPLGSYFGARPVVLVFVYYECPMLCTLVLNALASSLDVMSLEPGKDFDVVTISFDPRETPALAAAKKATYLQRYKRPGAAAGWHFLTGTQSSIDRATKAAGFRFVWDDGLKQFAHPTGIIVLTPDGRIARYLFGIDYGPRDLRLALVDASAGKVGSAGRRLPALLLSLRPDDRPLRPGHHACDPGRGRGDRGLARIVHRHHGSPRTPRAARAAPGSEHALAMWSGTPLFPQQASTMASRVDNLYFFLLAVSVFFSLLIAGLIVFYAVRYRRRAPNAVGTNIHGGLWLEVTWSVIPLMISMVIFVWGASVFFAMSRPPDETLNIYVVGKQWMWKFQHLDGQREINELHVPVGRAVKLIMTSEDVIHDVFVPAFRVKADVRAGPLHAPLVSGDDARPVSPVLRRVLRHAPLRHDRRGRGDGADRIPGVVERRQRRRLARVGGREALSGSGVQHLPSARRAGPRPGAPGPVRQDANPR